jgi:predicted metal-dependent HD superfamily phosphohydrolase
MISGDTQREGNEAADTTQLTVGPDIQDRALLTRLEQHWTQLVEGYCGPAKASEMFRVIADHYSSPGRHHHTLVHIYFVLQCLDEQREMSEVLEPKQAVRVRLAAWFHDIVYTTSGPQEGQSDEAASAIFADESLWVLGVPTPDRREVARLIRTTQEHSATIEDLAAAALQDADLAILGAPPALYDVYSRNIKKEYSWVPTDRYRTGRHAVLSSLLEHSPIFQLATPRALYEAQARVNIEREINSLAP